MSSLTKKVVVMLSMVVFGFVAVGYVRGRSSDDKAYRALTVYGEVLDRVQREYVDDPNLHQVTSGALHGLFDSLDPQSSYLSPLEYTDYKEKSAASPKAEAGLALTKRFGYISVISALPDSPAQKAGLQLGDVLEKIAGFTTGQMAIEQAQLLLSGDPGTVVKLSVIRRGKTEPQGHGNHAGEAAGAQARGGQARRRHRLPARSRISGRRHQADSRRPSAIRASGRAQADSRSARLRPRRRPGRHFHRAAFPPLRHDHLAQGTDDGSRGFFRRCIESRLDAAGHRADRHGTAGAAEILAGAIADNHRGETVGIRTYGTASQQKLIQLEDGSALILTLANYYTPAARKSRSKASRPRGKCVLRLRMSPRRISILRAIELANDPDIKKAIEILQGAAAPRKAA